MLSSSSPCAWLRVGLFALWPRCMIQLGLNGMGLPMSEVWKCHSPKYHDGALGPPCLLLPAPPQERRAPAAL